MPTTISSTHSYRAPRLARGTVSISGNPGRFMELDKSTIEVDHEYQRDRIRTSTIKTITKKFSWIDFGCLSVARRADGSFQALDGQHRLLAVQAIPEIRKVPCIVHDVANIKEEAKGFKGLNTARGNVTALDKFKADLVSGEPLAAKIEAIVAENNLEISGSRTRTTIECVRLLQNLARIDIDLLKRVMPIAVAANQGEVIHERLLDALFYIGARDESLFSPAITAKIASFGRDKLLAAAGSAAALYSKGGAKIWATGIVIALNKGARKNKLKEI